VTQENDENWIRESEKDSLAVPEASAGRVLFLSAIALGQTQCGCPERVALGDQRPSLYAACQLGDLGLLTRNELKRISFVRALHPCRRVRC
jgi:hypothetical protein